MPVYTTEGGWLNLPTEELVSKSVLAKKSGFLGCKLKIGKPHVLEDVARLSAVRETVGEGFEIMGDANQAFTVSEAIRHARLFKHLDLAWLEEPLSAEDTEDEVCQSQATTLPVAVGEWLYHISHFRDYLVRGACSVTQVDVVRAGDVHEITRGV